MTFWFFHVVFLKTTFWSNDQVGPFWDTINENSQNTGKISDNFVINIRMNKKNLRVFQFLQMFNSCH